MRSGELVSPLTIHALEAMSRVLPACDVPHRSGPAASGNDDFSINQKSRGVAFASFDFEWFSCWIEVEKNQLMITACFVSLYTSDLECLDLLCIGDCAVVFNPVISRSY